MGFHIAYQLASKNAKVYKVNSLLYKLNKKARKGIIISFSKKANIYKVFNILNKKTI